MNLLEVENLSVTYVSGPRVIRAVRGLSLSLSAGESLALVGETASGKSTVAHALMGLLDGVARVESGTIRILGSPLSFHDPREWRRIRGSQIGMIFQDARGALNPVLTIGAQLIEALRAHQRLSSTKARDRAASLLTDVGIPDPPFVMGRYPFEMSGGMCQRIAIASAICHRPQLLIADEPTSALDPSIQAQILALLRDLRDRYGLALILISHDLAMVAEVSEYIYVMYHGTIVESGRTTDVFRQPAHPYTASLLACQSDLIRGRGPGPLTSIPGPPPIAGIDPAGCAFAPRCPRADSHCSQNEPAERSVSGRHKFKCFHPNLPA